MTRQIRTPEQVREDRNRRRREKRLHNARQQACRFAASQLIAWKWGEGEVPAVTPEKVARKVAALFPNTARLQNITTAEATVVLIEVLVSKGLPVLLTEEEQQAATSGDAMVVSYAAA